MRIDLKMEKMSQKALERKSNKPIMEKKRRARINHCLNQLKALILETDNERSRHSKLEKADILEMTVRYLQTLRAYHLHLQQIQHLQQQQQPQNLLPLHAFQQSPTASLSPTTSPVSATSNTTRQQHLLPNKLQQLQLPLQLQTQQQLIQQTLNQHHNHHHNHHHHLNQQSPLNHNINQLSPAWRPW